MRKHKNKVNPQPDTSDISQRPRLMAAAEKRLSSFDHEIADGYKTLKKYQRTVTFFGSARMKQNHPYYKKARRLAKLLAADGFTIVTGGGGGIMQAGNHGAHDAQALTVGFNIQLPYEQVLNKYVTDHQSFHYFFTRKVMLTFFADAYVFFPGGFGTMDEFFEVVTLMQTHKIPQVPIILIGDGYWKSLQRFIKKQLLANRLIEPKDLKLFTFTDDLEKVRALLKPIVPEQKA